MTVLDTSFLISIERARPATFAQLKRIQASGAPVRVPAAVWIEYLYRLDAKRRMAAVAWLDSGSSFQPLTREIADEAVRIQAALAAEGRRLSWHDLQVAATASYLREPLATNDEAFRAVPGLDLMEP